MITRYNMEDMQFYAALKGGRCLSKEYVNSNTKLEWQCGKGHRWEADIRIIKQGGWCRACLKYNRNEEIMQELQEVALDRGGKCLSTEYRDWHGKLTWQCGKGHEWEAKALHIKNGNSWCPHCSRKVKLTIDQMGQTAKSRGGKCLSRKYVNTFTKLLWQCEKGHTWKATPNKINSGQWCPHYDCRYRKVSEKLRADIKEMQELAKERNGKLLSTEYTNRYTPLTWQCDKGHVWESKPVGVIHSKTWCPVCARKKRGRRRVNTTK